MSFIAELKRRNVVRVGIAYLLAAWVILQVSDVVVPILDGPEWVDKTILVSLLVGFPIAVMLAWVYELTPEGVKREKDVDRTRSISDVTGRKLDFVIIGVLVVAVAMFALDKFVWTDDGYSFDAPRSIAVLPFVNMTSDKEQEYFSDGLTEELLNLLARIPELRVASRTSSFFYKDKDVSMPDIERDLGVGHVLEGSVRRSGDKVRITAQLIDVPHDAHIWTEVWERTLDDIFAIQDEIANAVVDALKVRILGEVPRAQATSPEAYSLYLEAGQKMRAQDTASLEKAEQLLHQALEIDEAYVPAWLRLADTYTSAAAVGSFARDQLYSLARDATMEAIRVDPASVAAVDKLTSIGVSYAAESNSDIFTRDLDFVPSASDAGGANATNVIEPARYDKSISFIEAAIDDNSPNAAASFVVGRQYWLARRFEEAAVALRRSIELDPARAGAHFYLGAALLGGGDTDAALLEMNRETGDGYRHAGRSLVYHAMGDTRQSMADLDALLKLGYRWAYQIAQVYAFRGEADPAMEWLTHAAGRRDAALALLGGDPFMDNIRDDPRFVVILSAKVSN